MTNRIRRLSPFTFFSMIVLMIVLGLPAVQIQAHHSFAIYDFGTEIPFEGTVETLKFRNPHIEMTLRVVDEYGKDKIVHFVEGAPANMLVRDGLRPDWIRPGSHIRAIGSPLREDPEKFFLRRIILDNGKEFQ